MISKVTILDYGMCNLLNVARAFEHCGANVTVTEDVAVAQSAERLVVPGVGAFRDSIREIESRGMDNVIRRFVDTGRPFLGICVGMQMLFDSSEEFGIHSGLGLLRGAVVPIPKLSIDGLAQRVPHIGWNHLEPSGSGQSWRGTFLERCEGRRPAVYFVHSFAAIPTDPLVRLADVIYGGYRICAVVQSANLMATQFHPERSGEVGMEIIRGFLRI